MLGGFFIFLRNVSFFFSLIQLKMCPSSISFYPYHFSAFSFVFRKKIHFLPNMFLQKNLFFSHQINAQRYTRFIYVLENRVAYYVMAMIHDIRKCLHIHVSNILSLMAISGASNTTKSNFKIWRKKNTQHTCLFNR